MGNSRRFVLVRSYALAFAVVLSPALLQQEVPCTRGNANLLSLELEVDGGPNLIVGFDPLVRNYDVSTSGSTATVRADALINSSIVNWVWRVGGVAIGGEEIGVDGGEVTLPISIPDGQSELQIAVRIPPSMGTATALYKINIERVPATYACTEAGIRQAISDGGGPHYFDCEGQPPVVTTSTIDINNDVILDGEANLTVNGNNAHRVFSVPAGFTVELRGMTISGGGGVLGNGIYNNGALTVANSTVSNNDKGGIINDDTLTVTNSIITGNTNAISGGGITNSGLLTVTDSIISDNTSQWNGGIGLLAARGADISGTVITRNQATSNTSGGIGVGHLGALTITDSTVSDNQAATDGGGIAGDTYSTVIVNRCTVSGNSAAGSSGGIGVGAGGTLFITNTTVSGNSADVSAGGIAVGNGTAARLRNTTVTANTSALGGAIGTLGSVTIHSSLIDGDCAVLEQGTLHALYTVESDTGACDLPADQANQMDQDLGLGPLQDNGGPMLTHAPQQGSVALDVVPLALCRDIYGDPLTVDQRGVVRPEVAGTDCDAGAVEGYCNDCSDNECAVGGCDPVTRVCSYMPVPDGEPCDSGNGECLAGVCDHCGGVVCDDGNECTDNVCEPSTGACEYVPVPEGTSCESGHAECRSGSCRGPSPIDAYRGRSKPPVVAMNPSGDAIAVWLEQDWGLGEVDHIVGRTYSVDTGWQYGIGDDLRIGNLDAYGDVDEYDVAIDADGNGVAIWDQYFPDVGYVVNASYYTAGEGWGDPVPISEPFTGTVGRIYLWGLNVEMDKPGRAIATWTERQVDEIGYYVAHEIWGNQMATDGTWGGVQQVDVDTANEVHPIGPDLAIDWNGRAYTGVSGIAVWTEYDDFYNTHYVWARLYRGVGGWLDPAVQLGEGKDSAAHPRVVMDSDGNAIVVWRKTEDEIWTRRFNGSSWGDASLLVTAELPSSSYSWLDLAMAPFSRPPISEEQEAILAWSQVDGSDSDLWTKRYTPGSGWGLAERIETHDGEVSGIDVAFDGQGNATAVWTRAPSDGSDTQVWINRYDKIPYPYLSTDGWRGEERFEFVDEPTSSPRVAMDSNREGVVVFHSPSGPYGHDRRWTLAPAPTLSNPDGTHVASTQWCPPNNYFRLSADYWDPDGDVVGSSSVRVFVDILWSNHVDSLAGFPSEVRESEPVYNQIWGNGSSGPVIANNCLHFGAAEWADVTLTIWDAAENESLNSVTMRVNKPAGAD